MRGDSLSTLRSLLRCMLWKCDDGMQSHLLRRRTAWPSPWERRPRRRRRRWVQRMHVCVFVCASNNHRALVSFHSQTVCVSSTCEPVSWEHGLKSTNDGDDDDATCSFDPIEKQRVPLSSIIQICISLWPISPADVALQHAIIVLRTFTISNRSVKRQSLCVYLLPVSSIKFQLATTSNSDSVWVRIVLVITSYRAARLRLPSLMGNER